MTTMQRIKTCDGGDTNIFTGFLYHIRNQNYGDNYREVNYLNYQNQGNNLFGGHQVEIAPKPDGANWYFQAIGSTNYYNILQQDYGDTEGNENYVTLVTKYVQDIDYITDTVSGIVITTHSFDATNVWCIEPAGTYFNIRAFQNNSPGQYLGYRDKEWESGHRYLDINDAANEKTNWYFEPVWSTVNLKANVESIQLLSQPDSNLFSKQLLGESQLNNYPSAATLSQVISYSQEVTNTQVVTWNNQLSAKVTASVGFKVDMLASASVKLTLGYQHSWGGMSKHTDSKTITISDTVTVPQNSCVKFQGYYTLFSGEQLPFSSEVVVSAYADIGYQGKLTLGEQIADIAVFTEVLNMLGNEDKILSVNQEAGTITLERTGMLSVTDSVGTFLESHNVPCTTQSDEL